MKQHRKYLIIASLVVNSALSAGAAYATDHLMWREQVSLPAGPPIELRSEPVDPAKSYGNDSLPWREQVKIAHRNRVLIAEPALDRYGKSSDTRLWREQIRSDSSDSELVAARNPRPSDELQKQADN